jgi:hypothetical protein
VLAFATLARPQAAGNEEALKAMQFPRVEPRPVAG